MTDSHQNLDSQDNISRRDNSASGDHMSSHNATVNRPEVGTSFDGSTQEASVAPASKRIALVAHDNKKSSLLSWARYNRDSLSDHDLYATGTTGRLLEEEIGVPVNRLQSGPLGGDQQLGALISEDKIDLLIFFWDPLEPMPHDPDVKALLRIAVVWNIPIACNRASADYLISSPLLTSSYEREVPDFSDYRDRSVQV
jgi:methylglyoxal synthase